MVKEDIVLGVEIGKLKIEPVKVIKIKEENPFVPVSLSNQKASLYTKTCPQNKNSFQFRFEKTRNVQISKKKPKKILREPILKLLQVNDDKCSLKKECQYTCSKKMLPLAEGSDILGLCALVDNCNQLRISSSCNEPATVNPNQTSGNQWWRSTISNTRPGRETSSGMNQAGSCSQQALNPPCDVTIDELASYFETLVHIPKKMSSMAEMMYI